MRCIKCGQQLEQDEEEEYYCANAECSVFMVDASEVEYDEEDEEDEDIFSDVDTDADTDPENEA